MNWDKGKFEKLIGKLSEIFKENTKKNKYIYYENINDSRLLPYELNFALFAKGVADDCGGKIIGIMPYHVQNEKLLQALGGELDNIEKSPNWLEKIEIYIRLFVLILRCHTGDDVGKLYCRKVLIGDLIYSDIVRKHSDIVTLEKAGIIRYWGTYKKIITWTIVYDNKFAKKNPYIYIVGEVMHIQGVIYRLAAKHGAKLVKTPFLSNPILIQQFGKGYEYNIDRLFYEQICRKEISSVSKYKDISSLIYERSSDDSKAAFGLNKKVYNREEIISSLGLDPDKKNVVIFLHCLSDDSYHGTLSIYRDYYCWYLDTINKVKNMNNVNWIFREHPMAAIYGEEGVAKKIFDEHKTPNVYWMSKSYNGRSIPLIADAVITVSGTAGAEYSALGIPSVILGKPYYSRYGYTINIKSEKEYLDVLNKLDKINRLSENKTEVAKKVWWLHTECSTIYNTEIEGLVSEFRNKIYNGIPVKVAENIFLNKMINWLENNELKDSRLYKLGLNIFCNS